MTYTAAHYQGAINMYWVSLIGESSLIFQVSYKVYDLDV